MATYRQKIEAQKQIEQSRLAFMKQEEREANRRLCLSACECYCEGYDRGVEDARDQYSGALDRILTLGNDYAWPDSYRNGYTAGYGEG